MKITPSGRKYDVAVSSSDSAYINERCKETRKFENVANCWVEFDKFGLPTMFVKFK